MNTLFKTFSIISVLLALAACTPEQANKFETKQALWDKTGPSHYEFTVRENCGKPSCTFLKRPIYKVEVNNGKVIKVTNDESSVPGHKTFKWGLSFKVIFDRVAAQIANHTNKTIKYNETEFGFITSALDFTIHDFKNLDTTARPDDSEFEAAKKTWSDKGPSHYQFTVHDNCGELVCSTLILPTYTVEVKDGKVIKVTNDEKAVYGNTKFKWSATIKEIFDRVEKQLASHKNKTVKYDSTLGFITSALDFSVTDFKRLDSSSNTNTNAPSDTTSLDAAQQLWAKKKPNSYSFTVSEKLCNSDPVCDQFSNLIVYTVSVENDAVQKVMAKIFSQKEELLDKSAYADFQWIKTMDELFTRAREDVGKSEKDGFIKLNESLKFDAVHGYIKESAYYTITSFTAS